jgi:23S rRNA pseudouridine1911/1915/1917 synthase
LARVEQEFKRSVVSEKQWGTRIDHYLIRSGIGVSRNLIQKLIRQGRVLVNDKPVKPAYRLKEGDNVYVRFEMFVSSEIHPENIPLDIVYEDGDILVLNKPAGIIVHPAQGNLEHTLVNAVLYHCGRLPSLSDAVRPGVIHRLDKDTTGLIIFAKTDAVLTAMGKMIARRQIQKIYEVVCWDFPGLYDGMIEAPIGRSGLDRTKMTVTPLSSKVAATKFKVLERFPLASHLKVWLITGRTHQIRVHLKHIGCPVVGDPDYDGRNPSVIKKSVHLPYFRAILDLIDRQALHAAELKFQHPRTGQEMHLRAPLPPDMTRVLEYLRRSFPEPKA